MIEDLLKAMLHSRPPRRMENTAGQKACEMIACDKVNRFFSTLRGKKNPLCIGVCFSFQPPFRADGPVQ